MIDLVIVTTIILPISIGFFFASLALPKIIDVGSIDKFKRFRDKVLRNAVMKIQLFDIDFDDKTKDNDVIKIIKNDVYPLTAFISSLENFIERKEKNQSLNWKIFSISSLMIGLTIFFKLDFSSPIYMNFIPLILWAVGLELLILGIIIFFDNLKMRNKFLSDLNRIELGDKSIDDFVEEKTNLYRKILKKRRLF